MSDYSELVKALRNDNACLSIKTAHDAADAIEQLSNAGSAYGRGWTLGYDAGREEPKECKVCLNNGNDYCFGCDNGNQFKPLTNADGIRGKSDEELARWIAGYVLNLTGGSFDLSEQSWINWLKSPVEVDNG